MPPRSLPSWCLLDGEAYDLPSERRVVHQAGDGSLLEGRKSARRAPCLIYQKPDPTVAYFWTGGRVVNLHAACDALWKEERARRFESSSAPREAVWSPPRCHAG